MSRQIKVLRSGDRRVVLLRETHVSGWRADQGVYQRRCRTWAHKPVFGIGPAGQPGNPHLSEGAQGFGLIPIDNVGEAAGVVSEVAGEEKIGGNGV